MTPEESRMRNMESSRKPREVIGPHVDAMTLERSKAKKIDATVTKARIAAVHQLKNSGGFVSRTTRVDSSRGRRSGTA